MISVWFRETGLRIIGYPVINSRRPDDSGRLWYDVTLFVIIIRQRSGHDVLVE